MDINVIDLTRIKFIQARRGRNQAGNVEIAEIAIDLKIRRKIVKARRERKQGEKFRLIKDQF